jgi:hypothetical protein
MKVLALVYPGMTLLDLRSLAGVEFLARLRSSVCLALFRSGAHGLRPQRASNEQFRGRLD